MNATYAFQPGTSFLHRADPLSKMIWALATTLLILLIANPLLAAAVFVASLVYASVLARLRPASYIRVLGFLLLISLMVVVLEAFTVPGTIVVRLGPLGITAEGLAAGGVVAFRLMTIGLVSLTFTRTTDPALLVVSLVEHLKLPYRYAFLLYHSLRFIPVFEDEMRIIRNAHAVRGADSLGGSPPRVVGQIRRYTIPLLARGVKRARLGAMAMDSRGFGAYRQRTFLRTVSVWRPSLVFALLHVALLVAVVVGNVASLGRTMSIG